jgi:hypothetical protein
MIHARELAKERMRTLRNAKMPTMVRIYICPHDEPATEAVGTQGFYVNQGTNFRMLIRQIARNEGVPMNKIILKDEFGAIYSERRHLVDEYTGALMLPTTTRWGVFANSAHLRDTHRLRMSGGKPLIIRMVPSPEEEPGGVVEAPVEADKDDRINDESAVTGARVPR